MKKLTQQIRIIESTQKKVKEARLMFSEFVSLRGEDFHDIGGSLRDVLTALTALSVTIERERQNERKRWDKFGLFVPVVVGCGKARLRLACNKPNDVTDNPWTTVSVYESLKRRLIAREGERLYVDGEFPVDVIGKSGAVVSTIEAMI